MSSLRIKAEALVAHGRVKILDDNHALVKGLNAVYQQHRTSNRLWLCNCPAVGNCSHTEAVEIYLSGQLTWDDL